MAPTAMFLITGDPTISAGEFHKIPYREGMLAVDLLAALRVLLQLKRSDSLELFQIDCALHTYQYGISGQPTGWHLVRSLGSGAVLTSPTCAAIPRER